MKRILKRALFVLVALILFVACWYGKARIFKEQRAVAVFQIGSAAKVVDVDSITLACYNIAHARGPEVDGDNWNGSGRARPGEHVSAIARQISESGASVVVLNEIDFDARWSGGLNQARAIAEQAGFPYLVEQRNFDVTLPFFTLQFGNAVLSKFPVTDARFLRFPALSKVEDVFAGNHDSVVVTINAPAGTFRVIAVHLEYRDESIRVESAHIIARVAAESPGTPIVAMGDFNSAPEGFGGHMISAAGENAVHVVEEVANLRTLRPEQEPSPDDLTYPSTKPQRAIDWIFASPQLQIIEKRVVHSLLSDHRMVIATIEVNSP